MHAEALWLEQLICSLVNYLGVARPLDHLFLVKGFGSASASVSPRLATLGSHMRKPPAMSDELNNSVRKCACGPTNASRKKGLRDRVRLHRQLCLILPEGITLSYSLFLAKLTSLTCLATIQSWLEVGTSSRVKYGIARSVILLSATTIPRVTLGAFFLSRRQKLSIYLSLSARIERL